jgi:Fe-S cluster assembly ATP-binding protein
MSLLKIEKADVFAQDKKILDDFSMEIAAGEIVALMGPNGSGKSTLAQTILGNPAYLLKNGKIVFGNEEIQKDEPELRSQKGIACIWQSPPEIKGVELFSLLNLIQEIHDGDYQYDLADSLLFRETNVNFSGGEKKIAELVQVLNQNPKLLIIDELDSGLDLENLDTVLTALQAEIKKKKIAVLIITHSGEVLQRIKPDKIEIMLAGKIVCSSEKVEKVLTNIKENGYSNCQNCQEKR